MYARGLMVGLTRGTTRAHIVRAALESIAYQTRDVVETMTKDTQIPINSLRVDGGASANEFLMQFQADILQVPVDRPVVTESTARGAAFLAGIGVGFWQSRDDLPVNQDIHRYTPHMAESMRDQLYDGWQEAVRRSRGWERE